MKKLISLTLVLGLLCGLALPSLATAEEKIAIVSLQKALNDVNEGKKAKEKLKKEFAQKKKEIDKEKANLQKEADALQKQGSVLSREAMQSKTQALQKRFMELQTKAANYERELKMAELESANKIIASMRGLIEELAKKGGYTLVLENSTETVLFAPNAKDITKDLIALYNKKGGRR